MVNATNSDKISNPKLFSTVKYESTQKPFEHWPLHNENSYSNTVKKRYFWAYLFVLHVYTKSIFEFKVFLKKVQLLSFCCWNANKEKIHSKK